MCTCNAFTYRKCRYAHAKFEPVTVCLAARLRLRAKCQERIVNGHPNRVRYFPIIDATCELCFPEEARLEEEQKKAEQKQKKSSKGFADDSCELPPPLTVMSLGIEILD